MRQNISWLEKLETDKIENIMKEIKAISLSDKTNGNTYLVQSLLKINQECTGKCSKENIKSLFTIILQICLEITELTSKLKDNFLRIMYFLLQKFFQEDLYEEVLSLTKFLLPTWIPLSPVEEQLQSTYNSLSLLFLNYTNSYMLKNFDSKHFKTIDSLILNVLELKTYSNLTEPLSPVGVLEIACQFYKKIFYCKQQNHVPFGSVHGTLTKILEFLIINDRVQFNLQDSKISEVILQMHYFVFNAHTQNSGESQTTLNQYTVLFIKIFTKSGLPKFGECIERIHDIVVTFNNFSQLKFVALKRVEKFLEFSSNVLPDKILGQIFYSLSSYVDSVFKKQFTDEISFENQTMEKLLDVLLLLAQIQITRSYGTCQICSSCQSPASLITSTNILLIILKLGLGFIRKENADKLRSKLHTAFKLVQNNVVSLKNSGCTSWEAFLINCSLNYFNTCIKFTTKDSKTLSMVRHLSHTLLEYFSSNFKNRQIFCQILQKSLNYLAVLYSEAENEMTSREILVLSVILFKDIQYVKFWITIKQNDPENPVTMIDILQNNAKNLRELYPKFDLNEAELIDVALFELKLYNQFWPIRKPMLKILKFLLNNVKVEWKVQAKALQQFCQIGVPTNDEKLWASLETVIENLRHKIQQLHMSKKKENIAILELSLMLANLNLLKYVSIINQKRETNINTMLTASRKSIDRLDRQSDASLCWNIQREEDILKYINDTIDILINIFEKYELDSDLKGQLLENSIPHMIIMIPYIYQLHNYPLRAIKTAILCHNIFEQLENVAFQLDMITFLFEQPINNDIFVDLMKKANQLLEQINDLDRKRQFELLLLLGQSQYLYNIKEYRTGYEMLSTVERKYEEYGLQNKLIEARVDMLRVQYLMLPCHAGIEGHQNLLISTTQIMEFLIAVFKKIGKNQVLSIDILTLLCYLFNLTEWIGTLYLNLYLPREAKCYSRNIANLGFYLNLPLRYIQILCIQCRADLIYTKMDNYYSKLTEILELLSLREISTKRLVQNKKMAECQKVIDKEKITVNLEADHLLDSAFNQSEIIGTEIPQDKDNLCNITEQILNHRITCNCFYCININCQRILFEITLLEESNFYKTTKSSFEFDVPGKENLIDNFKQRQINILKDLKFPKFLKINAENIFSLIPFEKTLSMLFCKYALKCSNELYLRNNYDEALNILKRLYKLLGEDTDQYSYLISEILELNCTILYTLKISEATPQNTLKTSETTLQNSLKTPERIKTVTIRCTPEKNSPDIIDSTVVDAPSNFLTPHVVRTNKFFKTRTPGVTPAPPKFKIYTPIVEKKTRKNAPQCTKDVKRSPNSHDVDRLYTPYKLSPEPSTNATVTKPVSSKSGARKKLLTVPKESPKGKSAPVPIPKITQVDAEKPTGKSKVTRRRYKRIYTLESSDSQS